MSTPLRPPREIIDYRRSAALDGLEVLQANNSPREWRVVGSGYAVVVPQTWRGDVLYRGRHHRVEPGVAFCNDPHDALIAKPELGRAASFSVLVLQSKLFEEWFDEQQVRAGRPTWRAPTQPISDRLSARFARFFELLRDPSSDLELQSQAVELSQIMTAELVSGARLGAAKHGLPIRGAERMREFLNLQGAGANLESLAREVGLSRFQALRAFKRCYGLPPHAYQLCVRIDRARRLLLDGAAPAEVAARCGFVDQSHLTRHFKRIVGVTPMRYAQASTSSKKKHWSGVHRIVALIAEDSASLVSRAGRGRG